MEQQKLEILIDKWMNDVSFKEEIRQNPQMAIESCGVTLTNDDKPVLKQIDWSLSDEQLQSRVSKVG